MKMVKARLILFFPKMSDGSKFSRAYSGINLKNCSVSSKNQILSKHKRTQSVSNCKRNRKEVTFDL